MATCCESAATLRLKSSGKMLSRGDTSSVLTIGSGAQIQNASGGAVGSLILDSSGVVQIDHSATPAVLLSTSLTVDSSLINIELSTPATGPTSGLVITSAQLNSLLQSVQSLSLLSYSSIALYGAGTIGAVTQEGSSAPSYQLAQLALHATDIYYADTVNSSGITINAQTVSLDNLPDGTTLPSLSGLGTSDLSVNAETITLGSNALALSDFANVSLSASSRHFAEGARRANFHQRCRSDRGQLQHQWQPAFVDAGISPLRRRRTRRLGIPPQSFSTRVFPRAVQ